MLNPPDPNTRQELNEKMESVSEQIDISKSDFMSAATDLKENLNEESERFKEDLKDLKDRLMDLSGKGISVAKQTLSSNLETAKTKANQAAHCARDRAETGLEATRNYVKEKPCQSLAIALGIGFLLGKIMSRK